MTPDTLSIGNRKFGPGRPVYIIAEMSANHRQDLDTAVKIIHAARDAGADAVKLQTYTPDTLTIDCANEYFRIGKGSPWEGRTLYDLYGEAFTPWEWHAELKTVAADIGIDIFSTPFDETAVDFLETLDMPIYKIASFENVDIPLLKKIAATGKPVIMSTGMASLEEIEEAVSTLHGAGCSELALLKCTSAYPARSEDMHLLTIPDLMARFDLPVGVSDHTLELTVPTTAVALGGCIIEKHFTLARQDKGPDSSFSLEPSEFKTMVAAVRSVEKCLGEVRYGISPHEADSRIFRRSLFVTADMRKGDKFTFRNLRSIRPGNGLHTRYRDDVIGRRSACDIQKGTPLSWQLVKTRPEE